MRQAFAPRHYSEASGARPKPMPKRKSVGGPRGRDETEEMCQLSHNGASQRCRKSARTINVAMNTEYTPEFASVEMSRYSRAGW